MQRILAYVSGKAFGAFLIRSIAGSATVRIAAMVASFAMGVLLARTLGVEGYGYYGLALSIITIAGIPSELGISRVITREVAQSSARQDYPLLFGILRWGQRVSLRISTIVAIAIAIAGAVLLQQNSMILGTALIAGAPIIPLETLARLKGGALQGLHHIILGQIPANLLRPILMSLLILLLVGAGFTMLPPAAMALYSIATGAVLIIAHVWLKQRLPATAPATVVREGRRWLGSSIPIALADGMRSLQTELSVLLMGLIAVPAAVGLFRIASASAITAAAPFVIVARVALPVMARLHAERDFARLQKSVTAFAWTQFGGVVILSLPVLVATEPLLRLIFGAQFVPAATALRIIALGQIANAAFGPNANLLNMTHLERRVTRAMAIALGLNVLLVPLLVLSWGVEGAAIAYVSSLLCWNVITWLDARRILRIETSILRLPLFS
jgi:O-antigen/teichoic acid export membrane protein